MATISKIDTSQLEALRSKYAGYLSPTEEETGTQTQLKNLIASKELGIAKAEAEPMAQKFVTGQSTALEKSAALKSLPLQTRLENLQSQRTAAADVLKSQLGFEESNIQRQTEDRNLQLGLDVAEEERGYAEEEREENWKQQLKSLAMSLGVSTKTKKGGTLSAKNLEKAIAKSNKGALEETRKSTDLDYQLRLKELNKPTTTSTGTWSTMNIGGKIYKINSKTGEIQETGVQETGEMTQRMQQLRDAGWTEEEIKSFMLMQ